MCKAFHGSSSAVQMFCYLPPPEEKDVGTFKIIVCIFWGWNASVISCGILHKNHVWDKNIKREAMLTKQFVLPTLLLARRLCIVTSVYTEWAETNNLGTHNTHSSITYWKLYFLILDTPGHWVQFTTVSKPTFPCQISCVIWGVGRS